MNAVIFDMDGVLVDSERVVWESFRYVGEKTGVPDVERMAIIGLGLNDEAWIKRFRQEFGADYPTFWNQSHVYPTVTFLKRDIVTGSGQFTVKANGKAYVILDGKRYPTDRSVKIDKGTHTVSVRVTNPGGLPAIFVSGDIVSDESWLSGFAAGCFSPVGCNPAYTLDTDDVEVFPFSYERKEPVSVNRTELGYLYDFGEETFGYLYIEGNTGDITVFYGESVEEALAVSGSEEGRSALVYESVSVHGSVKLRERAFRYIHIVYFYIYMNAAGEIRAQRTCRDQT